MADEEKNEQTEEKPEEQPEAEAPAEEQPEEKADNGGDDAAAEAPAEDEAPAEEAPAEEAADDAAPAAEGDGAPASDDDDLDWKTKKRLERSRQSGEAGPQLSPEERAAARAQDRAAAIKSRSSYRRKQREGAEASQGTPSAERAAADRKVRQGRVVSNKSDKTITVAIASARRHPAYEKIIRNTRTLHVHDEQNEANEGDLVQVVETRPLSRLKRWRLVEILEKAK